MDKLLKVAPIPSSLFCEKLPSGPVRGALIDGRTSGIARRLNRGFQIWPQGRGNDHE